MLLIHVSVMVHSLRQVRAVSPLVELMFDALSCYVVVMVRRSSGKGCVCTSEL